MRTTPWIALVWAAHNPARLAPALEHMALYVSYGDGTLREGGGVEDDLEHAIGMTNETFVNRLEELGIPVAVDSGPGTHQWRYWSQGLERALPLLMEALED